MADLILDMPRAEEMTRELQQFLGQLSDDIVNKAVSRASTRTLQALKAQGSRIARREYTAHPSPLFSAVKTRREKMGGAITFKGKPGYSLYHFKPKPGKVVPARLNKTGVSTQVLRGGGRTVRKIPGHDKPFVMPVGGKGKFGIFVRESHGKGLEFQHGPSPVQAVIAERNKEKMQGKVTETFPKRLQHEIDVLISGIVH